MIEKTTLAIDKGIAVQAREEATKAHLSLLEYTNRAMAYFIRHITLHVEMEKNNGNDSSQPVESVQPPDADGPRVC